MGQVSSKKSNVFTFRRLIYEFLFIVHIEEVEESDGEHESTIFVCFCLFNTVPKIEISGRKRIVKRVKKVLLFTRKVLLAKKSYFSDHIFVPKESQKKTNKLIKKCFLHKKVVLFERKVLL